jgi:hypothetical protein
MKVIAIARLVRDALAVPVLFCLKISCAPGGAARDLILVLSNESSVLHRHTRKASRLATPRGNRTRPLPGSVIRPLRTAA